MILLLRLDDFCRLAYAFLKTDSKMVADYALFSGEMSSTAEAEVRSEVLCSP